MYANSFQDSLINLSFNFSHPPPPAINLDASNIDGAGGEEELSTRALPARRKSVAIPSYLNYF